MTAPYGAALQPGGGVLFDMDGLLLDSEAIFKRSWQSAAREGGYKIDDALFHRMVGRRDKECAILLQETLGKDFDFAKFIHRVSRLNEQQIAQHGMPVKPGAVELIEYLDESGVPLALATSTARPKALACLEKAGLLSSFPIRVTGDEIAHGKPAPDIYLAAAQRLGVDPARSLALEDSFPGVRSACAAGIRVILVPDLVMPTREIEALAFRVSASLHEVKRWLAGIE